MSAKRTLMMTAALSLVLGFSGPSFGQSKFDSKSAMTAQVTEMVNSGEYKSANVTFGAGQAKVTTIAADGTKTVSIYAVGQDGTLSVISSDTSEASAEELALEGFEEDAIVGVFIEGEDDEEEEDLDESDGDPGDDGGNDEEDGGDDSSSDGGDDGGGDE